MSRNAYLLRTYGITEDQYNDLLERQRGRCFICQKHANELKTRLCVDHNHKTKELRGLLCNFCNRRVIGRHTNPDLFYRAYLYLLQGTGLFAPDRKKRRTKRKRR